MHLILKMLSTVYFSSRFWWKGIRKSSQLKITFGQSLNAILYFHGLYLGEYI